MAGHTTPIKPLEPLVSTHFYDKSRAAVNSGRAHLDESFLLPTNGHTVPQNIFSISRLKNPLKTLRYFRDDDHPAAEVVEYAPPDLGDRPHFEPHQPPEPEALRDFLQDPRAMGSLEKLLR